MSAAHADGICDQEIICSRKPTGDAEHPPENKPRSYQRLAFTDTNLRLLPPTASVGENWKQEWKTKALLFKSKDRQKLFKVKGTVDGLHEFVKKHVNKDAERKDITIDGGWWMYLDDLHELKIMLKDKTGELQIVKQ